MNGPSTAGPVRQRFSSGITQLPPQPRRAPLQSDDVQSSSTAPLPPNPPPRPLQVKFSSGIVGNTKTSTTSSSLSSSISLREELEQVQRAFYGNVGAPFECSPANRISLLEDQQNVLTRRAHDALNQTSSTQRFCKQSVSAVEPLTALISKDRSSLVALTARAFSLADTARNWASARDAKLHFQTFEMRVVRAVLCDSSAAAADGQENATPPFLTSFVELELFLTASVNFGSVAYCNWSLLKRKMLIDDVYYDLVEQTAVGAERTLEGIRALAQGEPICERLAIVDNVVAAPAGRCSLSDLISICAVTSRPTP